MSHFPHASLAASIDCPRLRQRFVNASRFLSHLPAEDLLRVVRAQPRNFQG